MVPKRDPMYRPSHGDQTTDQQYGVADVTVACTCTLTRRPRHQWTRDHEQRLPCPVRRVWGTLYNATGANHGGCTPRGAASDPRNFKD